MFRVKEETPVKVRFGFLRTASMLFVVFSGMLLASAQQTPSESIRIDRLVALAKLWAAVKFSIPTSRIGTTLIGMERW